MPYFTYLSINSMSFVINVIDIILPYDNKAQFASDEDRVCMCWLYLLQHLYYMHVLQYVLCVYYGRRKGANSSNKPLL